MVGISPTTCEQLAAGATTVLKQCSKDNCSLGFYEQKKALPQSISPSKLLWYIIHPNLPLAVTEMVVVQKTAFRDIHQELKLGSVQSYSDSFVVTSGKSWMSRQILHKPP